VRLDRFSVLNELDGERARSGLRFVRYADDCTILAQSRRADQRVMASIRRFLEQRMRLQVNEEKSGVRQPEHAHFLCDGATLAARTWFFGGDLTHRRPYTEAGEANRGR
jgi:hypothetical protein